LKFRKKPVVIEAVQWFANGDHPQDNTHKGKTEGEIVRYYRTPGNGWTAARCDMCAMLMHDHGWIDTMEGGHIVCVGDWIIKGVKNEFYPCKPDIFELTYEPVND
jgi:hypothetical protein